MSANVLFDLPIPLIASVFELLQAPELAKLELSTLRKECHSALLAAVALHNPIDQIEKPTQEKKLCKCSLTCIAMIC